MTVFRVWAPTAGRVDLQLQGRQRYPMNPGRSSGWWEVEVPGAEDGVIYGFRLDGGDLLPDPCSLQQPFGPQGMSQTYDHAGFGWTDCGWRGTSLGGAVVYELHIGTFTAEGTFDAAIERLGFLVDLGVDVVEVMPVAAFPGQHGWGYDGINMWAVHEPYGGPDGLKRFVDACHTRRLAVVLDVVYNHVGPGNRLHEFGPYFTDAHQTLWGPALNLDQAGSDQVRTFLIENALMWLRDYHIDGLRLDAVDSLQDRRAVHLLEELATEVDRLSAQLNRTLVLIGESSANDPRLVTSREAGGYGLSAQWSNSFHHAVHAVLTGERQGHYSEFSSIAALAKTLTKVFFHDGTWCAFRGHSYGRAVDLLRMPSYRFLGYLQNHDQIGNRPGGDRISKSLSSEMLKIGAGLILTAPYTPLLFMGEEWGADTPWLYFTDYSDSELANAAAEGRRAEFVSHDWNASAAPDSQDEATFQRSKLDWSQVNRQPHQELLSWYRDLIALRRARPELSDPCLDHVHVDFDEDERWVVLCRGRLRIAVNLGAATQLPLGAPGTAILASSNPTAEIEGDTVRTRGKTFAVIET